MLPNVSPLAAYIQAVFVSANPQRQPFHSQLMFSHKSEIPHKTPISQMCLKGSAVCVLSIHLRSAGAFLNGISSVSQIT